MTPPSPLSQVPALAPEASSQWDEDTIARPFAVLGVGIGAPGHGL